MLLPTAALLAWTGAARAGEDAGAAPEVQLELHGYYRVRAYSFPGLYAGQSATSPVDALGAEGDARFLAQRLRLQPELSVDDRVKLVVMADAFDDVVWGDNESLAATALFAGDPSTTGMDGTAGPSVVFKRAWLELELPVGLLRVGRQPSNWGMGLLANAGDGFDDTFGENHGGSTYDRIIFATRPLAVVQAALGREDSGIPLYAAVGVDRLVEDPLIEYYGYRCATEDANGDPIEEGDPDYDPRCDPDGEGYHTVEHDYTDDTRTDSDRGDDWWVDQADDVMEMIYVLLYKGEGVSIAGEEGDVVGGVYIVQRRQRETDSDVLILDGYGRFAWRGVSLEGEVVHIGGQTNAIALPGTYDPSGASDQPLHKEADIWGYVVRAGYGGERAGVVFETGYASGDDDPSDAEFTGRPLHPDFNVGLLLYEEVLARITAITWTGSADGLWSDGGVYNSRYVFPQLHLRLLPGNEIVLAYLQAWPDRPDGSRIRCAEGDDVECSAYDATASSLGREVDLALHQRFESGVRVALEGGWLRTTDRLPTDTLGLGADGTFWTMQARLAWEF